MKAGWWYDRRVGKARKSKKIIGSSGRTRTYNPSVNSCAASMCRHLSPLLTSSHNPNVYSDLGSFNIPLSFTTSLVGWAQKWAQPTKSSHGSGVSQNAPAFNDLH
jgi:hypothetical protein